MCIRWPLVGDRGQIANQRPHAAYDDGRRAYYSNCEDEATKLTLAAITPPGPGIARLSSSAWQGQVVVCIVLQDRHVDRRIQGHERVVRQVDLVDLVEDLLPLIGVNRGLFRREELI